MSLNNAPITTPTTEGIAEYIQNEYKSLTGVTSIPTGGIVWTWSWALAAIYILLYRFGTWSFNQIFFSSADAYYKKERGREYGIYQGVGLRATLLGLVTGGTPLAVIPRGTLYYDKALDLLYTTVTDITINGAGDDVYIELQASEVGEKYNILTGTILELVSPLAGVPNIATISSRPIDGADPESDDDYFSRVDSRIKRAPQGGSPGDYYLWATEVDGIEDILLYLTNAGTVQVYPIAEGILASDKQATTTEKDRVEESIRTSGEFVYNDRLPLSAELEVYNFGLENYRVEIIGWAANGGTPTLLDTVEDEIKAYMGTRRPANPQLGVTGEVVEVNNNIIFSIINTITLAQTSPFTVDNVQTYFIPSLGPDELLNPKRAIGVASLAEYNGITTDP
jgi:uncharacterized phage protein gp47/JayE